MQVIHEDNMDHNEFHPLPIVAAVKGLSLFLGKGCNSGFLLREAST